MKSRVGGTPIPPAMDGRWNRPYGGSALTISKPLLVLVRTGSASVRAGGRHPHANNPHPHKHRRISNSAKREIV